MIWYGIALLERTGLLGVTLLEQTGLQIGLLGWTGLPGLTFLQSRQTLLEWIDLLELMVLGQTGLLR